MLEFQHYKKINYHMNSKLINLIKTKMNPILDENQLDELENILISVLNNYNVTEKVSNSSTLESNENQDLLDNFLSAKRVEGCSERTIIYYRTTIFKMLDEVGLAGKSDAEIAKFIGENKGLQLWGQSSKMEGWGLLQYEGVLSLVVLDGQ